MSSVYSVNIVWNEERDCFLATCPELPQLEGTGDYRAKALLGLERAIVEWNLAREEDDPPKPLPKTAREFDARFDDGESTTSLGVDWSKSLSG
jgi:predicted RNase H-like HicB family nuclease